jgi:MFS family permease
MADRASSIHHARHYPNLRWNFWMHCLEGGFYMAGLAFIAPETVLPSFVKALGGSDSLIAQVPVLLTAAMSALGLFVAPLIERLVRLQPFVVCCGAFQRLPYLVAALLMIYGTHSPEMLLAIVVLAQVMSGLIGGVGTNAWMEMVTRMIPPNLRASGWAIRYTIQGVVGLGAGVVVKWVLTQHPGATGYAWLHFICFGFLVLSWISQSRMKETVRPIEKQTQSAYGDYLRGLPGLLMAQPQLLRFVAVRFFGMGYLMLVGRLSIHALEAAGRPDADKGLLLLASMIGSLLGNAFAGLRGNRSGGRAVMIFSRVLCIGLCGVLPLIHGFWGFLGIFFVWGFGLFVDRVGDLTFAAELCPEKRRPTYLAILSFCQAVSLLAAAALSGAVYGLTQSMGAVALLSGIFAAVSLLILRGLPEVRGKTGGTHVAPVMGENAPMA